MKIKNLSVSYGENEIFKDFSLDIAENEITCILGGSGCGKTTFLNAICGQISYQGTVSDCGKISYVFQTPRLISSINIEKNLEYVLPNTMKKDEKNRIVSDILAQLEISHCRYRRPDQISGGEASRVALARAYEIKSDTLLMDEPFKGLDIALKYEVITSFVKMWQSNKKTVVFVTHDIDDALMIANRIIVFGKKPVEVVCDELLEKDGVRELNSANIVNAKRRIFDSLVNKK